MKLTTGILAMAMMAGPAWGQNPDAIDNTRSTMKSLQQKQANDSNAALNAAGVPAAPAKPAPGAPAKATALAPAAVPAKTAAAPATPAKAASTKAAPEKAAATKTAAPAGKTAAAPATQTAQKPAATTAAKPRDPMKPATSAKTAQATAKTAKTAKAAKPAAKQTIAAPAVKPAPEKAAAKPDAAKPKQEDKKWAMTGKRDPFFSPVVQQPTGSGCSSGKKCLDIGQINLRGVVKSDNGFIAVVTNNLNKAYFLRENDPVFNGYVVRITGDSVVFQETVQDKLGKAFTREVVKRIFTPAV